MTELKVGDMAPDFETTTDAGERVRLSDYRGKRVVLYFYPKDDTPGCTTQACGFRDHYLDIEEK
ncbi:MAG: peroxiredoxin, partial [Caldilineae bacterium]